MDDVIRYLLSSDSTRRLRSFPLTLRLLDWL